MRNTFRKPSALRGLLPLMLVVVALIGSVVVPAQQTLRILRLLRETTQGLAPAKIITAELQAALVDELSLLRREAALGTDSLADRYRAIAAANVRRLDSLRVIGPHLDAASAAAARRVIGQVPAWWTGVAELGILSTDSPTRGQRLQVAAIRHDSAMRSLAVLSSRLSIETDVRNERVRRLERLSLLWNVVLVIGAFAALSAVIVMTMRERRALADAEHRSHRESALREAAEAMAAAYTVTEVMQCITHAACRIAEGSAAYIEQPVAGHPPATVVGSISGAGTPALGANGAFAGSLMEAALNAGRPIVTRGAGPKGESILAIPLGSIRQPLGALFILSGPRDRFRGDDVAYAGTFGHLASLALEKVRVLHEAREGRQKLERVLASRSRLIRGFSHDVKNPVGAADGYAALLSDGIYGELSPQQVESVDRIRRSIHSALSLIDDLHELARAETGHLAVTRERVDVNALLVEMIDEYQAAARSSHLVLDAQLDPHLPAVCTSASRLRQIVSNLLSNAIKYTRQGSIAVQTRTARTDPAGVAGDWLQIHVIDTGPGIPADKRDFIFEEFSRIGPGDKSGAGLGLAISRLLAGALGGHITLESEVGRGSRFTLWLPMGGTTESPGAIRAGRQEGGDKQILRAVYTEERSDERAQDDR